MEKSQKNALAFSDFIYDQDNLFKTTEKKLSYTKADIEIRTNGLIAQMLEMAGVVDYQNITDKVANAVTDLHSQLSRGNTNLLKEYEALKNAIDTLRITLQ